jgi:hypothetical protein
MGRLWAIARWSRLGVGRVILADPLPPGGGFALPEMFPPLGISDEHPITQRKHEPGPPMTLSNLRERAAGRSPP